MAKSAADRIVDRLGPSLALQQCRGLPEDTLFVDGTLVPARDHAIADQWENCRYPTSHQGVIDDGTRLVVAVDGPLHGSRNGCRAWELSGARDAVGRTTVIPDGGYWDAGLAIPYRRERGQAGLPTWKEEHNTSHRKVRARVERAFARMKNWKFLRDCRLKGDGVHDVMLGIARLHNLAVAG